jgi:glycosyltransferase involved in cell wall biosynthesis
VDRDGVVRPLRILFVAGELGRGGAERQLVNLVIGLAERGVHVAVAVFYPGGPLEAELTAAGVEVRDLGKSGRWDLLGAARRMRGILRAERADVVHGYLVPPNLLSTIARISAPATRVVWGLRASDMRWSNYDRLWRTSFAASCLLSRAAHLHIANSHAGRDFHVQHGYPAAKVIVIPNGIDVARFRPSPQARAVARTLLEVEDHHRVVAVVGRFDPMKDHETFFEAASALTADDRLVFACIGAGPDRRAAELRQRSSALDLAGRLRWVDGGDRVPVLLNGIDVLASSSAYGEGFPNVVGEAMATGVPCAVTDVGDAAQVVGDLGWVVPAEDPAALADAVRSALHALEEGTHDPEACRARVVQRYSVEALVDRTLGALEALTEPTRRTV